MHDALVWVTRMCHSYLSSRLRDEALALLDARMLSPELVLHALQEEPILIITEGDMVWTFVMRHNCRRYLMAKHNHIDRFEEIYVDRE